MNNKSKQMTLDSFATAIAEYLADEYGDYSTKLDISNDEKYTIKNMVVGFHTKGDSVNNTANEIVSYLRKNRNYIYEDK
jgi:hypothetical protein